MEKRVDDTNYEICKFCDHFIEDNDPDYVKRMLDDGIVICSFFHLDDGDQEFDHDASPSGDIRSGATWKKDRPDLFKKHCDGNIGPNSRYHSQRGKTNEYPATTG